MRAVRYHEHGGPEVLRVEDDVSTPQPGPADVRVAVEAAGVNPVDTYFREGSYTPVGLPMTPGSDFAGVVDAVGEDVTAFETGDRVFGTGLGNSMQGTYAEYAIAPVDRLATLPSGVSFAEGAAVALVGVTAWRALIDHGGLQPAETCFVNGGSGGVGHVAVQLADAAGARVITTSSERYHRRLTELGADVVLDYTRDDLADAVADAGAPDVMLDHMLDTYLQFDADVAAPGARVVGIGENSPQVGFDAVGAARSKDVEFHFMSMFNSPDFAGVLDSLATLMADGQLAPDVHDTYSLEDAADAQREVMSGSFFGKLVIEL